MLARPWQGAIRANEKAIITTMTTPCEIAIGSTITGGYIQVYVKEEQRMYLAHRLAWIRAHGPIPPGLYVCHRCDNPPCHNVKHLFLGTPTDNIQDAWAKRRISKKTVCKRGHEAWSMPVNGVRRCLICHRDYMRRERERKKEREARHR